MSRYKVICAQLVFPSLSKDFSQTSLLRSTVLSNTHCKTLLYSKTNMKLENSTQNRPPDWFNPNSCILLY